MSNWDTICAGLGFKTEQEMFLALYREKSIAQLCEMFAVSSYTIRKKLAEHGVTVRGRGGPHAMKILEMTQDLVDEMARDGVDSVAARLGVTKFTLFRRKKIFLTRKREEEEKLSPSSPEREGEGPLPKDSDTPPEPAPETSPETSPAPRRER